MPLRNLHDLVRVRHGWRGDLLALMAGGVLPLAFAPFDLAPLAVLSLAALFAVWMHAPPRGALWRGWLFGLGLFGIGVSWIHLSIYHYGGVGLAVSLGMTLLFVVILAVFPALLGYCASRFFPGAGTAKLLLVLPAGWTLFEWVRGWLFTGFPWLSLGYSQIDTFLAGWAPIFGVYGVSWAVALSAALLLQSLQVHGRARAWPLLGIALLWVLAAPLQRLEWTVADAEPLTVSLIQGNVEQGMKWAPQERQRTLERYAQLTASYWDSALIIWPETAIPAFYHQVEEGFLQRLLAEARRHGTALLIGVPFLDPATDRYYNSVVSLGETVAFYHKHHLVPFTEYLPLQELVGDLVDLLDVPMSSFSAGAAVQAPLPAAGTRIGASICFEAAFGAEIVRALPDARLLVNVSNDAWFGRSLAAFQHLQIARMRALESGRPLLRATNTGITAIVDHRGRLQATIPQFEVAVLSGTVQPRSGMTPYAYLRNYPVVACAAVVLILARLPAGIGRRRRLLADLLSEVETR